MQSIPFYLAAYEGLANVQGVIRLEKEALHLEYQTKDGLFGFLKTDVKQLELHLAELNDVEYTSNIFRTLLIIKPISIQKISEVPGNKNGELRLKIARKDKNAARNLASDLSLNISRYLMRKDAEEEF